MCEGILFHLHHQFLFEMWCHCFIYDVRCFGACALKALSRGGVSKTFLVKGAEMVSNGKWNIVQHEISW